MTFQRHWRRFKDGGGFWLYQIDGKTVRSVTRLLQDSIPKPNLIDWSARVAAEYAVDNLAEVGGMERGAAIDAISRTHDRIKRTAGVKGTAIHALAQQVAAGEPVEVPDELAGYVDAYLTFLEEWQPEIIATEGAVAHRRWLYGGTFDLLCRFPRRQLCSLVDIKTGGSGIFPETCLQIAAYRHADVMLDANGREVAMPATEEGLGLWLLDDGSYELLPVQSGDDLFNVFLHARHVAGFMERTQKERDELVGLPLPAPEAVS